VGKRCDALLPTITLDTCLPDIDVDALMTVPQRLFVKIFEYTVLEPYLFSAEHPTHQVHKLRI